MAIIDIPGFVADIKEHATEHQFHIHDERHFVETYSMNQAWEVDLHPEHACGGPLDLRLSIDLDPRVAMAFEDQVMTLHEDAEPETGLTIPLVFTWALPPLSDAPDLLVLATDLAGLGHGVTGWPSRAQAEPARARSAASRLRSASSLAASRSS